jgi:SAM-dependent methyltransferase
MQDDSGLKKILTLPSGYLLLKALIGSERSQRWISDNFWRASSGQKVVDIGCGPGNSLRFLPEDIDYVGFDVSPEYVRHAQKAHAGQPRRNFLVGRSEDFVERLPEAMANADLVIINAVLHHLGDAEATTALKLARACLAPGGRLVSVENCLLRSQAPVARWIVNQDRGRNLRYESEWKALFSQVFDDFETHILTGLLRIPYTHIVVEAHHGR